MVLRRLDAVSHWDSGVLVVDSELGAGCAFSEFESATVEIIEPIGLEYVDIMQSTGSSFVEFESATVEIIEPIGLEYVADVGVRDADFSPSSALDALVVPYEAADGPLVTVVPLRMAPTPPNNDPSRALYVWTGVAGGALDPLHTDARQQRLINLCGARGVNLLFLDMYSYLGGANWSDAHVARMRQFIEVAHASGIRVYGLAGAPDWGQAEAWVLANIVTPIETFNDTADGPEGRFDGFIYDVEYWVDPVSYPAATHLPGFCDLVKATKTQMGAGFEVGCFGVFFLKDNDATRAEITYDSKDAQDGEHMMDVCDFVSVSCYYESAAGQSDRYQPWYDYASTMGTPCPLFATVEVTDGLDPETISYWEEGRLAMEADNTTVATTFKTPPNDVWAGHAIHDYEHYAIMAL
jgi:hypothetical protein